MYEMLLFCMILMLHFHKSSTKLTLFHSSSSQHITWKATPATLYSRHSLERSLLTSVTADTTHSTG